MHRQVRAEISWNGKGILNAPAHSHPCNGIAHVHAKTNNAILLLYCYYPTTNNNGVTNKMGNHSTRIVLRLAVRQV